jgi:hypothetical protein
MGIGKAMPRLGQAIDSVDGSITVRPLGSDSVFPNVIPHLNQIYGDQLAIDGSFSGVPHLIYDEDVGTPTEWDVIAVSGVWDLASTVNPYNGTKCIEAATVEDGDTIQISNGGCVTCVAITGWIRFEKWSEARNNHLAIFAWDQDGSVMIGNEVRIEDFVNPNILNQYQRFVIPLIDMGVTGDQVEALRIRVDSDTGEPNAPDFRMDLIELQEAGGGIEYTAFPIPGSWYYASCLKTVFSGVPEAFLAPNVPSVDYERFFNIDALTSGVVLIVSKDGITTQALNIKNVGEYNQVPEVKNLEWFGDAVKGSLTLSLLFSSPLVLKSEFNDFSRVTINEDLTGIKSFGGGHGSNGGLKSYLGGYTEFRP